jgi:hypothetical protein
MKGQIVVAKCFNGEPVLARIWDCDTNVVFIHNEEEYLKHSRGESSLEPIGFPVSDVYEYKEEYGDLTGRIDWSALTPIQANED